VRGKGRRREGERKAGRGDGSWAMGEGEKEEEGVGESMGLEGGLDGVGGCGREGSEGGDKWGWGKGEVTGREREGGAGGKIDGRVECRDKVGIKIGRGREEEEGCSMGGGRRMRGGK